MKVGQNGPESYFLYGALISFQARKILKNNPLGAVSVNNISGCSSGLREVETRLQADTAGGAALLKNLVVRLEDARILEDVEGMKRRLQQLKTVNGDLMREQEIRTNSSKELTVALKQLNVGVRHAARLRGE